MLRTNRFLALVACLALFGAAPAAQRSSSIEDAIDLSLRWLRGQQDGASGAYGDVAGSAWALRAFAESPRAYVPGDGPFVARAVAFLVASQREDGAITSAGASAEQALLDTALAARALGALPKGTAAEPLQEALAFVARAPGEPEASKVTIDAPADAAAARKRASELLRARDAKGSWGGSVVATARACLELTACAKAIAQDEQPSDDAGAATPLPTFSPADRERVETAYRRGVDFMLESAENGRWGAPGAPDAGLTAMAAAALAAAPSLSEKARATLESALDWLVSLQHEDGSIHDGKVANYTTSVAVMALVRAGREKDAPVIGRAQAYLKELQADEGEGYSEGDRYYGGIGYGGDERPDLSNLQMALEALAASGLGSDDPAFAKAVKFLERCQNRSESNDLRVVEGDVEIVPGNDGGAGYMPGDSKAGFVTLADGRKVPRSYGSMTYAFLKSMLFAGLAKDDPRVAAAWTWLRENYTLDVNPGFEHSSDPRAPYQGLFYYFQTMARTLELYGEERIVDGAGVEHAWRPEIAGRMLAMQRPDGSWVNHNSPRWWEGNPVLATAYALQTLDATL